jgi:hypothetical protein
MTEILPTYKRKGRSDFMSWEPISNVPSVSGHYVVGHRGRMFGTAYYNAGESRPGIPAGWSQIPSCSPTHWLNSSYDICELGEPTMRIWFDNHHSWNEFLPRGYRRYSIWDIETHTKRMSFFDRILFAFTGKFKF